MEIEVFFQVMPIFTLLAYFLYLSYYYAAPMFWLRVLMFIGYKKYRCTEIHITEENILVKYSQDGEEREVRHELGVDLSSRFFVMTACSVLRGIFRQMRRSAVEE